MEFGAIFSQALLIDFQGAQLRKLYYKICYNEIIINNIIIIIYFFYNIKQNTLIWNWKF